MKTKIMAKMKTTHTCTWKPSSKELIGNATGYKNIQSAAQLEKLDLMQS